MAQLCSGLREGMEGAIHVVCELFDLYSDDSWGILLINAFNHIAALWNVRIIWPLCSRFLFNSNWRYAGLFIERSNPFLFSKEGVTQRDPLSMMLYAVAVLPLNHSALEDSNE